MTNLANPYDQEATLEDPQGRDRIMDKFTSHVRDYIQQLRGTYNREDNHVLSRRREIGRLMLNSMANDGTNFEGYPYVTFGSWITAEGEMLGYSEMYEAAMAVCEDEGFTIEEARQILDETPEPDLEAETHRMMNRQPESAQQGHPMLDEVPATVGKLSAMMSGGYSFGVGTMISRAISDAVEDDDFTYEDTLTHQHLETIRQRVYDNTDPGRGKMDQVDGMMVLFGAMADAMDDRPANPMAGAEDLLRDLMDRINQ